MSELQAASLAETGLWNYSLDSGNSSRERGPGTGPSGPCQSPNTGTPLEKGPVMGPSVGAQGGLRAAKPSTGLHSHSSVKGLLESSPEWTLLCAASVHPGPAETMTLGFLAEGADLSHPSLVGFIQSILVLCVLICDFIIAPCMGQDCIQGLLSVDKVCEAPGVGMEKSHRIVDTTQVGPGHREVGRVKLHKAGRQVFGPMRCALKMIREEQRE